MERLCRYIAWPALAEGRLSLTAQGQVRYTRSTPYRDGTTHVVFAPHSRWRAEVTPAGRGKATTPDLRTPAVIGRILGHRASRELPAGSRPPSRGPPQGELELP